MECILLLGEKRGKGEERKGKRGGEIFDVWCVIWIEERDWEDFLDVRIR